MCTYTEVVGFHGTTLSAGVSIQSTGFKLSSSDQDWLGHGVYFFIDGVSNPLINATEWALNNSQGNIICVVKVKIKIYEHDVLDMRSIEGLKKYNFYRDEVLCNHYDKLSERRDFNIKKRKDIRVDDCTIIELIRKNNNYNTIIHNVYIKNEVERKLALESSYPNSTVLCTSDLGGLEIIDIVRT